jgi:hypothetical protein
MFLRLTGAVVLLIGMLSIPEAAVAQSFRVYTTVYDVQAGKSVPVARSLSLFHAGKTYDFIQEVGEVIIFEPGKRGFTLLNTRQQSATTVLFEELNGKLKVARETLQAHLNSFPDPNNPQGMKVREQLQFQLSPQFEEIRDNDSRLTLKSPHLSYGVRLGETNDPANVTAYLNYADWTSRLNFVLYPGPIFPEPRIAVNSALRKVNRIPTEVELIADVQNRIHRRAEHRIDWNLDETDRDLIHQWEKLLESKRLKKVTFEEYQRALLVAQGGKK